MTMPLPGYTALPGSAELQRLHDVLSAPQVPTEVPAKPAPLLELEKKLADTVDDKAAEVFFTLNSVTVQGVNLYEPTHFLPLFKRATGQKINVKELYELVDQITTTYRNDGYILARAVLPPQDITKGHVTVQVVEGRLDNVIIRGDSKGSKLIRAYADKLKGDVLNAKKLERYLLLMNDLPGVTATSTLQKAATPGASDLVIDVAYTRYEGQYAISNWGTRFVGPNQLEGDVSINNSYADTFGWHDQTTVRGVQTTSLDDLSYLDISHMLPISEEGMDLTFEMHRSLSKPGYTLEELDLDSTTEGFAIQLSQPWIRSRRVNFTPFLKFDWRDTTTNSLSKELSNDHVRAFRAGFDWDRADDWDGITTARLEVSQGTSLFGASNKTDPNKSRLYGVADRFTKIKLDFARLQRLHKSWNVLFAATGQYTTTPLLAGEEFGLGGENYGRGFDTSEITGDNGWAAKAELQINFPVGWEYLQSWQFFGFYDIGTVWERDPLPGQAETPLSLASMGVGIRTRLKDKVTLDLTLAQPKTREVLSKGDKDPSLYVRLKNRF
jgi:hemolysin activation/secretion protein